jgi:hypothetical protein
VTEVLEDTDSDEKRSRHILALLVILLLGSPGALLIFAMPREVAPMLLFVITPITLLFIILYRNALINREKQAVS